MLTCFGIMSIRQVVHVMYRPFDGPDGSPSIGGRPTSSACISSCVVPMRSHCFACATEQPTSANRHLLRAKHARRSALGLGKRTAEHISDAVDGEVRRGVTCEGKLLLLASASISFSTPMPLRPEFI